MMKRWLLLVAVALALVSTTAQAQVPFSTKLDRVEREEGVFEAHYPQVKDCRGAARINATILQFVEREKKNWRSKLGKASKLDYTRSMDYEIMHNEDNLLSFNFTYAIFLDSGRLVPVKDGMTFDVRTGQLLNWRNLVDRATLQELNVDELTRELLEEEKQGRIKLYYDFERLTELPDNYYVDADGTLHFQIPAGQIAHLQEGTIDWDTQQPAQITDARG